MEDFAIRIAPAVLEQIRQYFSFGDAERGALLGSSTYFGQIDAFAPVPGTGDAAHFLPDMDAVNARIARWMEAGICFSGFIHSHPGGAGFLSGEDRAAVESWTRAAGLPFLCFGVMPADGGIRGLKLWIALESDGRLRLIPLEPGEEYTEWRYDHA